MTQDTTMNNEQTDETKAPVKREKKKERLPVTLPDNPVLALRTAESRFEWRSARRIYRNGARMTSATIGGVTLNALRSSRAMHQYGNDPMFARSVIGLRITPDNRFIMAPICPPNSNEVVGVWRQPISPAARDPEPIEFGRVRTISAEGEAVIEVLTVAKYSLALGEEATYAGNLNGNLVHFMRGRVQGATWGLTVDPINALNISAFWGIPIAAAITPENLEVVNLPSCASNVLLFATEHREAYERIAQSLSDRMRINVTVLPLGTTDGVPFNIDTENTLMVRPSVAAQE